MGEDSPRRRLAELEKRRLSMLESGNLRGELMVAKEALDLATQCLSATDEGLWQYFFNAGHTCQQLELHEDAQVIFARWLSVAEESLGPVHSAVQSALWNLAVALRAQRKYAEAEPLLERLISITEQRVGPRHAATLPGLELLADTMTLSGKYEEAEAIFRRVVSVRSELPGRHRGCLDTVTLCELARVQMLGGHCPEAAATYRKAISMIESVKGMHSQELVEPLKGLRDVCEKSGAVQEAEAIAAQLSNLQLLLSSGQH